MRVPLKNKTRLFLLILAAVGSALICLAWYRVTQERAVLMDDLYRRARVISRSISPAAIRVLKHPPSVDEEDVAERLSGLGRTLGLIVCNRSGEAVALSAALVDLMDCHHSAIQEVLETRLEKTSLQEEKGQNFHSLIYPLEDRSGDFLGVLVVVHEASYIQERVRSAVTWMTFTLAMIAVLISFLTYFLSRRSFQHSIQNLLQWMHSQSETPDVRKPTESLLKPVAKEVEKLTARLRAARETAEEVSQERNATDLWTSARLKAHAFTQIGKRPLVIVSNREPYVHTKEQGRRRVMIPASGLVTALDPIARATSGLWVAHGSGEADRETADKDGKILVPPHAPTYTLKRIWLTKEEEEGYYYGFSNEALWPLFQLTHHRPQFEEKDWFEYNRVNEKFAEAVADEFRQEKPFVLVQDYHFTLLPKKLKEKCPRASVGLFWHIPWPTFEKFQVCPWKREILEGMLGSDFIGFHLQSYCNNFLDTANNLLPVRIDWDRSAIVHDHGTTIVKPLPISVQAWTERDIPAEKEFKIREKTIREELELKNLPLAVSVDRLDYTKGIPERLGAIDRFLEKYPQYKTNVVFVQLVAPSRTHNAQYRELVSQIEELVDQINWKHAVGDWKPVIYLKMHHDAAAVYTFLRMADVCVISSLSDGMNLVAKEYVLAQENENGVLILSEFAGVAREFQEALHVNPYARADFAETIRIALEMPIEEKKKRMKRLKSMVTERNVYQWAAQLMSEITASESSHRDTKKTATL